MAQDDYFSFGDEDLESELDLADFGEDLPDQALALAEAPIGDGESGFAAKRAARPRGDSEKGSSERRLPSSRRTRVFGALALGLLAVFLIRIALSAISGGEPAAQNQASTSESRPAAPSSGDPETHRRAEEIQASRERAAERQRARRHRAQTRRRARRRRQRVAVERHQRARERHEQEAALAAEAPPPAPEYIPPTYESAPPPSTSAASGEGHLHDGASSPEFGL